MSELQESAVRPQTLRRKRSRRSRRLNWAVALFSWTLAGVVLTFSLRYWLLTSSVPLVDAISVAFGVIGATIGGFLALSGDGDVILFTGPDERQRAVMSKSGGCAFGVAFWGMFILWMAYQIVPAWRADAYLHVGMLLLATMLVYLGGYLWQRSHA